MTNETHKQDQDGQKSMTGMRTGVVVSDKRNKTCAVLVEYQIRHAKYGKYLKRHSRFHVHDPNNQSKIGDQIEITNCRPVSKTKSWRLVRVLKAAPESSERGSYS